MRLAALVSPGSGGDGVRARRLVALLSIGFAMAACAAPSQPLAEFPRPSEGWIGVLSEPGASPGEKRPEVQLRVAFRTDAGGWMALASPASAQEAGDAAQLRETIPSRVRWTMCRRGRAVGTLDTTLTREEGAWATLGVHLPGPGQASPLVGDRSEMFAGWQARPVRRPMVATSLGSCGDPEGWSPAKPTDGAIRGFRAALRRATGGFAPTCGDEGQSRPYAYPDERTSIEEAWHSRQGRWIATVRVLPPSDEWPYGCQDNPPVPRQWRKHLISLDERGEGRLVGLDMTVLDIEDLDLDGRSEVIAVVERYNEDGYAMLFDEMRRLVQYSWRYH